MYKALYLRGGRVQHLGLLAEKGADAAPARVAEKVADEAEAALVLRGALVVRPDDEHGAADDEVARDGAPVAAVATVVAVVAHHEVVGFGDAVGAADAVDGIRPGTALAARRVAAVIDGVGLFGLRPLRGETLQLGLVVAHRAVARLDAVFGQEPAVDVDVAPFDLDGLARQADDALDEERLVLDDLLGGDGLGRVLEDDDVAAADVALREEGEVRARPEDELIDEEAVADVYRVLHRGRGDFGRLRDEGHEEHRHDQHDRARLEVLAHEAAGRPLREFFRAVVARLVPLLLKLRRRQVG